MNNYQTFKNIGLFLTQDHLTDGPGVRNARKLLQETAKLLPNLLMRINHL
jgi:hypothetical protein